MSTFPKTERPPDIFGLDDSYALQHAAKRYRADLQYAGHYLRKPLPWFRGEVYFLSNFYYDLWTYYIIRLRLIKDYGHDIDESGNQGFLDRRAA